MRRPDTRAMTNTRCEREHTHLRTGSYALLAFLFACGSSKICHLSAASSSVLCKEDHICIRTCLSALAQILVAYTKYLSSESARHSDLLRNSLPLVRSKLTSGCARVPSAACVALPAQLPTRLASFQIILVACNKSSHAAIAASVGSASPAARTLVGHTAIMPRSPILRRAPLCRPGALLLRGAVGGSVLSQARSSAQPRAKTAIASASLEWSASLPASCDLISCFERAQLRHEWLEGGDGDVGFATPHGTANGSDGMR
eukprot:4648374-Pleurochrysis_carterae.AAC.1